MGAWRSAPVCPGAPGPQCLKWVLPCWGGGSWSEDSRVGEMAEAVFAGMDLNVEPAARAVEEIALGQGTALGFRAHWPCSVQVSEPLEPGLGACGAADSWRWSGQEKPSAVSASAAVVAAEACAVGGDSGGSPCPCQAGPFGM